MIPHSVIDDIRQAADIVDIISDYLALQPAGRNYKALSPFTKEKTPSFVVSPDKQIYKCFSTGKGGNVFSFVMEMEKVSFPEAVELVAKRTGIDISRFTEKKEKGRHEESWTETLRWTARFYHGILLENEGKKGASYLKEKRGLTEKTIKSFGLGYAPEGWEHLLDAARKAGIQKQQLCDLGLLSHNKQRNSWYDTFRNRVIFPIFSVGGQVVGFGGRTLRNDPETPKYLNSPESRIFEKSKLLYGLHAAKSEIRREETAILVEGYMDVLALHQAGITSAIASCGTSLTHHQAKILHRYAGKVLFIYDADPAGQKSMMTGIDILLAHGITPFVVTLPEGDDPDSFVSREGRENFLQYTSEHRTAFLDFQIGILRQTGFLDRTEDKSKAVRRIVRSLSLIPDRIAQELYLQELSEKLSIGIQALQEILDIENNQLKKKKAPDENRRDTSFAPARQEEISVLEKTFLKALLESTRYGNTVLEFAASHEEMLTLPNSDAQEIFSHLIRRYHDMAADPDERIDISTELSHFGSQAAGNLATGLLMEQPVSERWLEKRNADAEKARICLTMFLDAFRNLILEPLVREENSIRENIRRESDTNREMELMREKKRLDERIKKTTKDLQQMIGQILSRN
ncbi:MAG: DNA primase [Chlorobiaceae bacterium]|nr:DNA primase [Chlorobiaceae bacterium]NTV60960.1 DNA primase [Chlorobiaceae bacterium]